MDLFGRTVIYTDVEEIDSNNIIDVLNEAIQVHNVNEEQIQKLYDYYTGKQDILNRTKTVRPEINNTTVVNIANQIVTFKTGYLIGEPVQYVNRGNDENIGEKINVLNGYMLAQSKPSKDIDLVNWMHIAGTGYRIILPSEDGTQAEIPFETYVLDPRQTFVVYKNDMTKKEMLGVYRVITSENKEIYTCYSADTVYTVENGDGGLVVTSKDPHILANVPIVEYPLNKARIGVFETVIGILDAINTIATDRVDAVEQFVQALMVFKGVDIESGDYKALRQEGAIKVPVDGNVEYLIQELNQTQTQTLVDYFYDTVLTIVGMPSQGNGNTSDSSNNGAVILKNGWSDAEARAKSTELIYDESERKFLILALIISDILKDSVVQIADIDIKFTRRNYENIESKAQVLVSMLNNEKINPQLAFTYSNMFPDPESAYLMSKPYIDKVINLGTDDVVDEGNDETNE